MLADRPWASPGPVRSRSCDFGEMTMIEQDEEAYELFRRAIVNRDENAWSAINAHYRPLLVSWATRCSAHASSGERADDIADQALARAWAALTPEGFAKFPSLARLLSYLRTCVVTTAIDSARSPQLFPDVAIVYSVKRNLFDRLQRNHDLLQLRDDFIS